MRVGLIGTGFMGRVHAAAWAQTPAEIAGYFSLSEAAGRDLAGQFGGQVFVDLDELLAACDVVDICTPTHTHLAIGRQAAAAGKPIDCEKPLARTVAEGQALIAACREAGVALLVAQVVRFFPEFRLARDQIAGGELGAPAVIRLRRGTFQPRRAEGNWYVEFDKSGGMMLDLMIHDFDYARWIGGEVDQVYARHIGRRFPEAGVDHALVILTHRGGAISHVEGSWAYPPPLFRTQLEIACSNGWVRHDSEESTALLVRLHQQAGEIPDVPLAASPLLENPYTTQIRAFYRHLTEGTPLPVTAADGLAAVQIALGAIESAQTGRPDRLPALPEVAS